MDQRTSYYLLSHLTLFSVKKLRALIAYFGDAETLAALPTSDLYASRLTFSPLEIDCFEAMKRIEGPDEALENAKKRGIRFITEEEKTYPKRLKWIEDAPLSIYVRGALPEEGEKSAGIVGARRCTGYGKESAFYFGETLSNAGVNVVSGMALGIDGYAGRGALSRKNKSFAVLGGGVDVCYPRENIDLYERLLTDGGIVSERPPGYPPKPFDFPRRNRLIAGLSDVLLVIEAAEKSGSFITANLALEQNKEVFALPGRVTDPISRGCNLLIRSGAEILTCPEDVLQYLGVKVRHDRPPKPSFTLSKEENAVFQLLTTDERTIEELMEKSGYPVSELLPVLVRLEILGAVKKGSSGGYFRA